MKLNLTLTDSALIQAAVAAVTPPDPAMQQKAQDHLNDLTKPLGSLGRLEELAVQLAGITGTVWPDVAPGTIVVMVGDHGVTAEGVSAYPSEVTRKWS